MITSIPFISYDQKALLESKDTIIPFIHFIKDGHDYYLIYLDRERLNYKDENHYATYIMNDVPNLKGHGYVTTVLDPPIKGITAKIVVGSLVIEIDNPDAVKYPSYITVRGVTLKELRREKEKEIVAR